MIHVQLHLIVVMWRYDLCNRVTSSESYSDGCTHRLPRNAPIDAKGQWSALRHCTVELGPRDL